MDIASVISFFLATALLTIYTDKKPTKKLLTIIKDKKAKLWVGYIRKETWQGTQKYSFEHLNPARSMRMHELIILFHFILGIGHDRYLFFNLYLLFAGLGSVRMVKNCDRGLENAARGRRPMAAFSSPRSQFFRLGGKRMAGVPGYGVPGCWKRGVWKTRGLVDNAGSCGQRGVLWKTRGLVDNAGSGGKRGVWWKKRGLGGKHGGNRIFLTKMRSLNFVILNYNENTAQK